MKETKEERILELESRSESIEFRKIANGRRFFKVGERLIDICEQEIERFNYEHAGFFTRLFNKSKFRNKKEKYMLESRIPSAIRAVAAYILRNDEENDDINLDARELSMKVREYILRVVKEYDKQERESSKVIDIKTKTKKEA